MKAGEIRNISSEGRKTNGNNVCNIGSKNNKYKNNNSKLFVKR